MNKQYLHSLVLKLGEYNTNKSESRMLKTDNNFT